jgi:hypothetical protein
MGSNARSGTGSSSGMGSRGLVPVAAPGQGLAAVWGQAAVPDPAAAWGLDQAAAVLGTIATLPQASGQEASVCGPASTSRPHAIAPAPYKGRESQAREQVFPVPTIESHSMSLEPVMSSVLIYGAVIGVIGLGGLLVRHLHRSLDVID